jgi:hypothetical protein
MKAEIHLGLVCFMYLRVLYSIFSSHPDWEWKHKFAYEIQSLIVENTLKTKVPSYDTILKVSVFRTYLDRSRTKPAILLHCQIDAQLKEFSVPPHLDWNSKTEDRLYIQRSYVTHVRTYHFFKSNCQGISLIGWFLGTPSTVQGPR